MGEVKPIIRPSERLAVMKEMVAMGCKVQWDTNTGLMEITPPGPQGGTPDAFDMVDFRR
ncbi:hypothetical protein [Rhodobacter sp. 24-YEA-8]|uniref:hypothetical protein n=1 Tax=Rhodobacter sp. 24-YEA-8 TaxID=1884310 RepID=UPI00089CBA65|nr:hypothetical protein [Rhodobacter sp. 24-YEA-8]SEB61062.1 hypothetical protein SAMN05519105_0907 [Rhodobacter sp. 24-YEA-8]